MGQPAAKQGDQITDIDTHIVMIPTSTGAFPTPLPNPFTGIINGNLSPDVIIMGMPAATAESTAQNTPSHIPQGGPFQDPPSNQATIQTGSSTVYINGKPAARNGDIAITCNDPTDLPIGTVHSIGTVIIG